MHPPASDWHAARVGVLGKKGGRATTITVTAVIAAGLLLLGSAVGFGLRLPTSWLASGPVDGASFDYAARGGSFGPLRDDYVRSVLGRPVTASVAPGVLAVSTPRPAGPRAARPAPTPAAVPAIVPHAFTNDDFEHAYDVTSLPFAARSDTTGATRQAGEPVECSPAGGTAWYRYKASAATALFADTFGSPVPTTLAVFRGDGLNRLQHVGCDTNVRGNAQVGFRAMTGATYYFQVTPVKSGPTVFELAAVGPTTVQTLSPSGAPADATSVDYPDISADGRHVVFLSYARNLTKTAPSCSPSPMCQSVYVRDRVTGVTTLIASALSTAPRNEVPHRFINPTLSADGRYVGFAAFGVGPDITPDDVAGTYNAYLYDRASHRVELVSRNSAGAPARPDAFAGSAMGSFAPSISDNGRHVAFTSDATNLGGPEGFYNAYLRDRLTGITRLVSIDAAGNPMRANNEACMSRTLSGDGRYVAFKSSFGNGFDSTDTFVHLIYLWDASTGRSRLVSKVPQGVRTKGNYCASISHDGSHVAWVSRDALVADDTNGTADVYEYEVATGRLERVSVTSAGKQTFDPYYLGEGEEGSAGWARAVTLSADGRIVAFDSAAPELAPGAAGSTGRATSGSPGLRQVYLHDRVTGATVLASVSSTGEQLGGESTAPHLSADGRAIAFMNTGASGFLNVLVHELR